MMASRLQRSGTNAKRATNVSLSEALVAEARSLGVSVSQSCEEGLAAAVKKVRQERWVEDNRAAFDSWNDYTEKHGLPLAKYRMF